MNKRRTTLSPSNPPPAPSLDTGLGLFAALATNDPKSIQIEDLQESLNETRKELESRNLLLIRSKEALSTLGERLTASSATIQQLEANECRLESELDDLRSTLKENHSTHEATVNNLREHLSTVRSQCAIDVTTAREAFSQQEHEWQCQMTNMEAENVKLKEQLAAANAIEIGLNEELSQAQDNIEDLCTKLSLAETKLKSSEKQSQLHLDELNRVREQFSYEEKQRKELAARVSSTELEVIDRLRQKQVEVDSLKLKVDSHKKYLKLTKKARTGVSSSSSSSSKKSSKISGNSANENKENFVPVHNPSKKGKRLLNGGKRTPKNNQNKRTPSKEEELMYILNTTPTNSNRKLKTNIIKKKKGLRSKRNIIGSVR
jgi:chromosome segregation ATPase